jgi:uncharacterized membrane protein
MATAIDNPAARRGSQAAPEVRVEAQTTELTGGLLLGLGLGGFIDGIVFHQIAQWHSMGSAVLPPTTMESMSQNMAWDGIFHAVTWVMTFAGIVVLWREGQQGTAPRSLRVLIGQMLLGWGLFNFVEGLIDHHLLGIHHVRDLPTHVPLYDWIFLGVGGALLIVVGWLLSRPRDEALR